MSKILIHTIVFSPDGVSTAYLYNDIANKLKESGYEVVVYTTTPHYNLLDEELKKQPLKKRLFGLVYSSVYKGISVNHIYQKKYASTLKRILGFVYWHFMSFFLILFERDVNVILSPSPPLTLGFVNVFLAKLKGAKVIYNVQEVYPDLLISEGSLKSKNILFLLQKMEKFVYNFSTSVTTIDNVFYNTISNRFKDKNKLSIIPNFVDTDLYKPIKDYEKDINKNLFPTTNDIKLMYAGNIGLAQEWDTLIELAKELKNERFSFFVIGNGAMKTYIEEAKKEYGLNKLHILPYQNREDVPKLLAYSDVQFIFMNPKLDGHGFPSKVYTIMACAKPMLIASRKNTPIVNFLTPKECSYISTHVDSSKRVKDFLYFLRNISKEELKVMGDNGVRVVEKYYSKDIVTGQYLRLIEKIAK